MRRRNVHPNSHMLPLFLLAVLGLFPAWFPCDLSAAGPPVPGGSSPEAHETRGWSFFEKEEYEEAVSNWRQAAILYDGKGEPGRQAQTLIHLSLAYQYLGRFGPARESLESALILARKMGRPELTASILGRLGNLSMAAGEEELADRYLQEGLQTARELRDPGLSAVILNDRGTLQANRQKFGQAMEDYRECTRLAEEAGNDSLAVLALTNAGMAALRNGRYRESLSLAAEALERTQGKFHTHHNRYILINIALTLDALRPHLPERNADLRQIADNVFRVAADASEKIGDTRTSSYAWGFLGKLYEEERLYHQALHATRRASSAAQRAHAPESLYRWQWQAGRLLRAMGNDEESLSAYRNAIYSLQSVRREMSVGHWVDHSSFRETIRPVYLEFVDLLLRRSASLREPDPSEPYLAEAREILELFKVAEVRDYFQDDCVDIGRSGFKELDRLSKTTAVVYPILLPDRLELLVTLPEGLRRFSAPVGSEALTLEIREFRRMLEKRTTNEYLPHARKLYDWLIRPIEEGLKHHRIDTLVFVPDGPLRTIPIAALSDDREFLVNRYALAVTPGLLLTDPRTVNRENPKLLAFGLTESVQGFSPLPFVSIELQAVGSMFRSILKVNRDFTLPIVEKTLEGEKFTIVHIASHGKFENTVEKSFLLTFDDKMTMDRLDQFVGISRYRDDPLDLLTLSACETAVGDDRAALGLAGIAVKAGARSALASLWYINDQASSLLVEEFYRQLLNPNISRAVALQRAQMKLIGTPHYRHPGYWAPYLLINNWL